MVNHSSNDMTDLRQWEGMVFDELGEKQNNIAARMDLLVKVWEAIVDFGMKLIGAIVEFFESVRG